MQKLAKRLTSALCALALAASLAPVLTTSAKAATAVTVTEGTYYLQSACGKNLVLHTTGAKGASRADVNVTTNANAADQQIKITAVTSAQKNGYKFTFVNSDQVVDVYGGDKTPGTKIIQFPYHQNNNANQAWYFEDAGDGYYYIRSGLGTYLDVYNCQSKSGTKVIAWKFNGCNAQKWRLVDARTGSEIKEGTYYLKTKLSGNRVLTAPSSKNPYQCTVDTLNKSNAQKVKITKVGKTGAEGYKLTFVSSNHVLDVQNWGMHPGTIVGNYPYHAANNYNQTWYFQAVGDGSYWLRSGCGTYLDVAGWGTASGTPIIAWSFHGGGCQKWTLVAA